MLVEIKLVYYLCIYLPVDVVITNELKDIANFSTYTWLCPFKCHTYSFHMPDHLPRGFNKILVYRIAILLSVLDGDMIAEK